MSSNRNLNKKRTKLAFCNICKPTDLVTQPNLALTPRDIRSLSERGMSVSAQRIGQINDNDTPSDYLPLEDMRGTDLNTAWEISQKAKNKVINSYKHKKLE